MNILNRKKITQILVGCLLMVSVSAFADKLDDAKAQGLVGEMQNGYLGAVVSSPATNALVEEINQLRKSKYEQLAAKNNITVKQVEALAAKKTFSKTAKGNYVRKNGKWIKK